MAKSPPSKPTRPSGRESNPLASDPEPKVEGTKADGDAAESAAPESTDLLQDPEASFLPSFHIVGIGASAGGLEALSQLLHHLSPDTGMALVLVQHLAPKHESFLAELLGGKTPLPVVQVIEGVTVKPNNVYVIPPNMLMGIFDGKLHLLPRSEDHTPHMPINFFLRSLADYAQNRSVGVILSGTASDGAIGVREIRAVGGITIVQDLESAKYDGMPRAAIATGAVDLVLPPEEIAAELSRIGQHLMVRHVMPRRVDQEVSVVDDQLRQIFSVLRSATGVDFTYYKLPTIRRRLERRMMLHKIPNIDHYLRFLQENPEEVKRLYSDILIHVTRFFREPDSFAALTANVFPKIMEGRSAEEPVRIWIPGCATGEEAYSVAISLLEYLGDRSAGLQIQIFATDVSEASIEHARAGAYPDNITADVSAERLRRFFTKTDGRYRINKSVRDVCIFARQDLTRDPPFSKLDLVVCRNVMIYLGVQLQSRLLNVFHYALKPSGFLMLGPAETVASSADLFAVADKRHRLYTKKLATVRDDITFSPMASMNRPLQGKRLPAPHRNPASIHSEANRVILERYAPAGVLVENDLTIVQFRGQTGRFLEPAPGDASLNLLKMAREGLLHALRSAVAEARRTGNPVRRENLQVRHNGDMLVLALQVIPLEDLETGRHFVILFEEKTSGPTGIEASPSAKKKVSEKRQERSDEEVRIDRLQQELAANREYLQSIIQDLEAANEELQSANEEILSSNEELQSTNEELDTAKEELQSTNEELNTVNEELHGRNEELSQANSDLINLLGSVNIAIVMVSSDLRIRRITPMAERVLNLIPGDVGRPISDIKPNVECPDLARMIRESVDSVSVIEREVADRQGCRFSLRIRPYKNLENKIDGAVITLFGHDGGRASAPLMTEHDVLMSRLIDVASQPMMIVDDDLRVRSVNEAFSAAFDVPPVMLGERPSLFELGGGQWNQTILRSRLEDLRRRGGELRNLMIELPFDGRTKLLRVNARVMMDRDLDPGIILIAFEERPQG